MSLVALKRSAGLAHFGLKMRSVRSYRASIPQTSKQSSYALNAPALRSWGALLPRKLDSAASQARAHSTRQFSTTRPHQNQNQNYTINKTLVLQHLEQHARIGASKARLEQFDATLKSISPEESKDLLKSAHARISEIIIYFIVWCKDDEKYMTTFDQAEALEGSELYRARAAVSTMLNCIAHDISKIPKTDPSRAENAILDMQIDDIVEVTEKYPQDADGKPPANWSAFWEEIYILMHSLGSELEKGGYGEE